MKTIEITVTEEGSYRLNGRTLVNNSAQTLTAALEKEADGDPSRPVTIRADARAMHQSVVTAMDVVAKLGYYQINIATVHDGQDGG
jgi:biopolymer transport protein ExbD